MNNFGSPVKAHELQNGINSAQGTKLSPYLISNALGLIYLHLSSFVRMNSGSHESQIKPSLEQDLHPLIFDLQSVHFLTFESKKYPFLH